MSNVDRLFGGLADWIADIRTPNTNVRIPLCRINYAVSAPHGEPPLHTFVVYMANNVRLAGGGGRTIEEAARKCWLELMGLKADGIRGLQEVSETNEPAAPKAAPPPTNPLVQPPKPHRRTQARKSG